MSEATGADVAPGAASTDSGDRGAGEPGTGDVVELDVGPVAHGGHCVARVGDDPTGRVVFVRHTLPGERVRARLTEAAPGDRFWRADAVEVLRPAADRVPQPCPYAGPGLCGGCDFQHVTLPAQRRLKADVVSEQLQRLGGVDLTTLLEAGLQVEEVPGGDGPPGLGWRTRVRYAVDRTGRVGLRRHRSHDVLPIERCPLVTDAVDATGVTRLRWPGVAEVAVAATADGSAVVRAEPPDQRRRRGRGPSGGRAPGPVRLPSPTAAGLLLGPPGDAEQLRGRTWLREEVPDVGTFRVSGDGFWQVHPGAAATLAAAVREAAGLSAGERLVDLYSGVGLFALACAPDVGPEGSVVAVEADERAVRDCRRNVHDVPTVQVLPGDVAEVLGSPALTDAGPVDVVVLDPPRTGARARVVGGITALAPRTVVYVACDPAALGRDTRSFADEGYELVGLRAFDLFPMTHHVECVAVFRRPT